MEAEGLLLPLSGFLPPDLLPSDLLPSDLPPSDLLPSDLPPSDLPPSDFPPSLLGLLLDPAPLDAASLEVPEDEGAFALPVLDSAPVEDEDSAFIAFFLDSDG